MQDRPSPTGQPDRLDAQALRAALLDPASAGPVSLEVAWSVDSTNAELWRRSPVPGWEILLAEQQTAGRGRLGRSWVSPLSSQVCMSLRGRFAGGLAQLEGLSLVAGVALVAVVWARWERSRRDPWLQLLDQARQRLQAAGLPLGPAVPARSMAQQARQHFGDAAAPASHWLLQLEMLRYAPGGENSAHTSRTLATLRREFHQLSWPPAI